MFESIFSGAAALARGFRCASRYRAAERADLDALRRAIKILDDAGTAIVREDIKQHGSHPLGSLPFSKVYHAKSAIESQLNDVISLAMGEKLK